MAGRRGRRKSSKKSSAGLRGRSAISGRFIKVSSARKNKRTSVVERTKRRRRRGK